MWEAIRANARRSRLLIGLMGAVLVGLGALFGAALSGGSEGGAAGAVAALIIWMVLLAVAMQGGSKLVLMAAGARPLVKEDAPQFWNVAEEMTIASGLGTMPSLHLIDDDAPNAFATGRRPGDYAIAVTSGLLRRLNRDELQGVIAHEMAHIRNQDVRFMTLAVVMMGSIALLADMYMRLLWYGGGRRRQSKGGGQAQIVLVVVALVAAVLAPIAAQALYFACSRRREYLADASAARFTRYPTGLASALEKISGKIAGPRRRELRGLSPLFIVNPLRAGSGGLGLFSSHPPVEKRIQILRAMAGAAGWVDYEKAYRSVTGTREGVLDRQTLAIEGSIAARAASPETKAAGDATARAQQVDDILDRMVNFLLIACACGVRVKIPPDFKGDTIPCPRCARQHTVPHAEVRTGLETAAAVTAATMAGAAAGQAASTATGSSSASGASLPPLHYRRRLHGEWESFRCGCGRPQQLSPAFEASVLACRSCGRRIEIQAT